MLRLATMTCCAVALLALAALPCAADPRFHALEGRPEPSPLQARVDAAPDGATIEIPAGEYRGTLLIDGRRNLTLRGQPGAVTLVSSNPRADIVHLRNSQGIRLHGLRLGHDVEVWCVGSTLTIRDSQGVIVEACDIHGSGVHGIDAMRVSDLRILDSHVHDCTYTAAQLYQVDGLTVTGSLFRRITQTQTSNQGLALADVRGAVEIRRNSFVDNTSIPITLEGGEAGKPAPRVALIIEDNLFAANSVPPEEDGAQEIRDISDPRYSHAVIGGATVRGNCFERTADRPTAASRFSPGAQASGNLAGELVLDPHYQVVQGPQGCKGKGAPPLPWLAASERHDDPRQQGPLRGLRDVLGFQPSEGLLVDRLYPIGFSRSGLLACLVEHADEAVGEYLWSFEVRSLVDDQVKASLRWDQFDDAERQRVQELNAVLRHRGGRIVALLQQHHIDSAKAIALQRFPYLRDTGDRYEAAIETAKGKDPESLEHRIVVTSSRLGRKTVGTLHASTLYPGLDVPEVLGFLESPFGRRVAVVVGVTRRGYEGPPHVRTFQLFGAHLGKGFKK